MNEKDKYDTYCSICGFPIKKEQVGICIDDYYTVDFEDRSYITLSMHLCLNCWEKVKLNTLGGMKKAIKKHNEMNATDRKEMMKK